MKEVKMQIVCGFGCGSSLFLRIKIDQVLRRHGLKARTFCSDVSSACSADCDVIFISSDLYERIKNKASVPVVVVKNFLDDEEVTEKILAFFANNK
jgi:PTS system ascorbate-specific IIB component